MERLKTERRWCIWKRTRSGRKIPYISSDTPGKSNDSSSWLSFEQADALLRGDIHSGRREFYGLGIFFSEREGCERVGLCGIDVDVHRSNAEENPLATELLEMFSGTYAERSPSGKGVHILCNVDLDRIPVDKDGRLAFQNKNEENELEIYIGGIDRRYFTFTGDQKSLGDEITDQTDNVLAFLNHFMRKPERIRAESSTLGSTPIGDAGILERLNLARRSKYGKEFSRLYDDGDISQYGDDPSRADLGLARKLCFWLGRNPNLIDCAFRRSKLYRDKWDERRPGGTYGSMTIDRAIASCEDIYVPPEKRTRQTKCVQWQKELELNELERPGESETPDLSTSGALITPEDVLTMINEAQDDPDTEDRITVFPLMCGTGKSTALRLKMRQIIEANDGDGMIIVTDSIDRMRDYLNSPDPEMQQFLLDYGNLITVMTHDTIERDLRQEPNSPILIMSTQRYIRLTRDQIRSYLSWNGGRRSLIVIDEQPYFKRQIDIRIPDIREISAAIEECIPHSEGAAEDREKLVDFFKYTMDYLPRVMDAFTKTPYESGQYIFYYKPNMSEAERRADMWRRLQKYRNQLNQYSHRGEFVDILTMIRAVFTVYDKGCLVSFQSKEDDVRTVKFSVLLDNYLKFFDVGAKVIVLDGTADLSIAYTMYEDLDMRNCDQYKRDLSRLHMRIMKASTGMTMLERNRDKQERIVSRIETFLRENISEKALDETVFFSYKFMKTVFSDICDEKHFDWFGNIKGKNDYRNAKYIAQVGVNRFPITSYFLYELEKDSELRQQLNSTGTYAETMPIIKERIAKEDGLTREVMKKELLAELEQNLFRGIIRSSDSTEDYTFFLFASSANKDLVDAIYERYGALNADIRNMEFEDADETEFMKTPKTKTAKKIVEWHDLVLPATCEYTNDDIEKGTGFTLKQINEARKERNNKFLHKAFQRERIQVKPARYQKRENWYYRNKNED